MADDKTKRGSPDNKRLNKSEPYEVAYAKSKRAKAAKKAAKKPAKKTNPQRHRPRGAGCRLAHAQVGREEVGLAGGEAHQRRPARKSAPTATVRAAPHPPKGEKTAENTAPRTMKESPTRSTC